MPRLPPKPRTGLAGRLTEARRFRGLTQQRLGELCGTSQAVIQKIENGRSLLPRNINKIAEVLESITGREVFDPTIYYFQDIPTIINPVTIAWISVGAMLIAISASVLPALRAARMHPVEALRYE